jgi:hypothetical protein
MSVGDRFRSLAFATRKYTFYTDLNRFPVVLSFRGDGGGSLTWVLELSLRKQTPAAHLRGVGGGGSQQASFLSKMSKDVNSWR